MNYQNNWYCVSQLADNLYGISEPKHFEEVNSFLLVGRNEAILIDTGMGFYDITPIIKEITDLPCRVLNTHSHFDHVGSNSFFNDISMFDHPDNRNAAQNGFDSDFLSQWIQLDQFLVQIPDDLPSPYFIPPFPHAKFFKDGNFVGNGDFDLEVIHTPGHSDDSVCFWEKNRGWLFAGDLLYEGPIFIDKNNGMAKFKVSISKISQLEGLKNIYSSHNFLSFSKSNLIQLQATLKDLDCSKFEEELIIHDRFRLVPEF